MTQHIRLPSINLSDYRQFPLRCVHCEILTVEVQSCCFIFVFSPYSGISHDTVQVSSLCVCVRVRAWCVVCSCSVSVGLYKCIDHRKSLLEQVEIDDVVEAHATEYIEPERY